MKKKEIKNYYNNKKCLKWNTKKKNNIVVSGQEFNYTSKINVQQKIKEFMGEKFKLELTPKNCTEIPGIKCIIDRRKVKFHETIYING